MSSDYLLHAASEYDVNNNTIFRNIMKIVSEFILAITILQALNKAYYHSTNSTSQLIALLQINVLYFHKSTVFITIMRARVGIEM